MAMHKKPSIIKNLKDADEESEFGGGPKKGIGPAPKHMHELEKELWDEVVSNMHTNVMGESERITFELLINLMARQRYSKEIEKPPLSSGELTQLIRLTSLFGMTPVDRERIRIPKTRKDNPFAAL